MLETHVFDHYAQFSSLETGLRSPDTFMQSCAYQQLPISTRKALVVKYYSVDERLLRELVGRKLSSKTRRELSDIAERCELRLPSCKRQFDNLLFVARRTEDLPGHLVDNIQSLFLLPTDLSESYAAVVFITTNRFEVLKRSLSYITFADLTYCAGQLLSNWCAIAKEPKGDAPSGVELDLHFFHDLKECKLLAEKKELLDRHRTLVIRALNETKDVKIISSLDTNFKHISKAVITIACGLSQARETQDLLVDIVEKLVEPMRALSWPAKDVKQFFEAYGKSATLLPPAKPDSFRSVWMRFIVPFSNCVERMYHS
ncbi:unnamed protein product [Dicrocoelium dendriticum]|nr:unnamed protein product [Dicrocoelium dendriticum]